MTAVLIIHDKSLDAPFGSLNSSFGGIDPASASPFARATPGLAPHMPDDRRPLSELKLFSDAEPVPLVQAPVRFERRLQVSRRVCRVDSLERGLEERRADPAPLLRRIDAKGEKVKMRGFGRVPLVDAVQDAEDVRDPPDPGAPDQPVRLRQRARDLPFPRGGPKRRAVAVAGNPVLVVRLGELAKRDVEDVLERPLPVLVLPERIPRERLDLERAGQHANDGFAIGRSGLADGNRPLVRAHAATFFARGVP